MTGNAGRLVSSSLLIVALLWNALAVTPTKDVAADDNLYYKALRAYVEAAAVKYKDIQARRDYTNLLVVKEIWFKEPLPSQFGTSRVTFVTNEDLVSLYQKAKSEIPITFIRPIQNDGSMIIVDFGEYWFSYEKKGRRENYKYALEGGCKVKLKHDATLDQFIVFKIDCWGI